MRSLLSANFARLKKSKVFWICTLFMAALGICVPLMYFKNSFEGYHASLDQGIFTTMMFIGIILSVFCSLYTGTEYSDGTIRNKIIIGHTRTAVYLSNLVTAVITGVGFCIAFTVTYICVGRPLLGGFTGDIRVLLAFFAAGLVATAAFSSIFTLIAMLCQNKAVTAITSVLLAFILLFGGQMISSRLDEPKMWDAYVYVDESGEIKTEDPVPNPNYISGTKRDIYEFLNDFLPGGQQIQFTQMQTPPNELPVLMLYSAIVIAGTTAAGVICFSKKDLK